MSNKILDVIAKISLIAATLVVSVFAGFYIHSNFLADKNIVIENNTSFAKISSCCEVIDGVAYIKIGEIRGDLLDSLLVLKRHFPDVKKIILTINSYGGCLTDAFGFIDILEIMQKENGVEVEAKVAGACMSAAVPILAICSYRVATKNCTFMTHSPTASAKDTTSEEGLIQLVGRYVEIMIENTHLSSDEWLEKILVGDFFDSEQALEWGLIDEIM